ncbi:MAG: hypothetical protein LIO95_05110 [Clostridiales bacterium]|nr:hypothetical protein [Clostridiales bacterium]
MSQPAISFNHARGNWARVGQIIRSTAVFTTLLGSAIALLCFLFRHQIIALFIETVNSW